MLTHLYVLMPVLDDRKHYFIDQDEVAKLLARGEGWLPAHPQRELIVSRYLGRRRSLVNAALARLIEADGSEPETVLDPAARVDAEAAIEKPLRLHERRLDRVCEIIAAAGAKRVLDLGCGSGKLLARLIRQRGIEEIVGVEVSSFELARATKHFARLPEGVRRRLKLWHGSLTYRDTRLRGFDAAALVEVVEHLEPDRLAQLEGSLFGDARPRLIVVTTPNRDYNALFAKLEPSRLRHPDHRFEWSRQEFQDWADASRPSTATTCDGGRGRRAPGPGLPQSDGGVRAMRITVPEFSLVLLIGASGSGKSTFADGISNRPRLSPRTFAEGSSPTTRTTRRPRPRRSRSLIPSGSASQDPPPHCGRRDQRPGR